MGGRGTSRFAILRTGKPNYLAPIIDRTGILQHDISRQVSNSVVEIDHPTFLPQKSVSRVDRRAGRNSRATNDLVAAIDAVSRPGSVRNLACEPVGEINRSGFRFAAIQRVDKYS